MSIAPKQGEKLPSSVLCADSRSDATAAADAAETVRIHSSPIEPRDRIVSGASAAALALGSPPSPAAMAMHLAAEVVQGL